MRGKGHIERYFETVGSLFCQFAAGYLGRNADRRGRRVEEQPLWSLLQMQDLLDEWLIFRFSDRPTCKPRCDLGFHVACMSVT